MFSWKGTILRASFLVLVSVLVGFVYNYYWHRNGIRLGEHPLEAVSGLDGSVFLRTLEEAESKWRAGATFVDARDELFYEQGHIPRAVSLPVVRFDEVFPRVKALLPDDGEIVCYCSGFGCEESTEAAERLIARGYRKVYVYEGGWPEWSSAGLPMEKGPEGDLDD